MQENQASIFVQTSSFEAMRKWFLGASYRAPAEAPFCYPSNWRQVCPSREGEQMKFVETFRYERGVANLKQINREGNGVAN